MMISIVSDTLLQVMEKPFYSWFLIVLQFCLEHIENVTECLLEFAKVLMWLFF